MSGTVGVGVKVGSGVGVGSTTTGVGLGAGIGDGIGVGLGVFSSSSTRSARICSTFASTVASMFGGPGGGVESPHAQDHTKAVMLARTARSRDVMADDVRGIDTSVADPFRAACPFGRRRRDEVICPRAPRRVSKRTRARRRSGRLR
ncbi:MAG: hypothetical protein CL694_07970 [Chloroflexi bacterium]|nr:hypothetical protein [Chloroflexota bacterium]